MSLSVLECQKCPITMSHVLDVQYVLNVRNVLSCNFFFHIASRKNEVRRGGVAHRVADIADHAGRPDMRTFSGWKRS